jgi:predicted nucleic acid-binding protein
MDLVVDANVLFSILIKEGKTEEVLFHESIHSFAPEFLLEEFQKHESIILEKTHREHKEFEQLMGVLKKRIVVVPKKETRQFQKQAVRISPDKKDKDYFSLAIKLQCSIWSNDKRLKEQKEVRVYSTKELMMILSI